MSPVVVNGQLSLKTSCWSRDEWWVCVHSGTYVWHLVFCISVCVFYVQLLREFWVFQMSRIPTPTVHYNWPLIDYWPQFWCHGDRSSILFFFYTSFSIDDCDFSRVTIGLKRDDVTPGTEFSISIQLFAVLLIGISCLDFHISKWILWNVVAIILHDTYLRWNEFHEAWKGQPTNQPMSYP